MNEQIKKVLKSTLFNWWFGVWAILSVILLLLMFAFRTNETTKYWLASFIMGTMMIMPIRNTMFHTVDWALDFIAFRDPGFRKKYDSWATMKRSADKEVIKNPLFYFFLFLVTGVISLVMMYLCFAFKKTSFNFVYMFLHELEYVVTFKIHPFISILEIVFTIVFFYILYWFIGTLFSEDSFTDENKYDWENNWWKVALVISSLIIKIITHGIFLKLGFKLTFALLGFWIAILLFIAVALLIMTLISRIRANLSNNNPNP